MERFNLRKLREDEGRHSSGWLARTRPWWWTDGCKARYSQKVSSRSESTFRVAMGIRRGLCIESEKSPPPERFSCSASGEKVHEKTSASIMPLSYRLPLNRPSLKWGTHEEKIANPQIVSTIAVGVASRINGRRIGFSRSIGVEVAIGGPHLKATIK